MSMGMYLQCIRLAGMLHKCAFEAGPRWAAIGGFRSFSDIRFDGTDADVDDLIESSLDKTTPRRREEDARVATAKILTTRREALSLYREIYRLTALFDWPNEQGQVWRDVLRGSARQEFEAARFEQDPEIVNRLLVVGRDAVHRAAERFANKHTELADRLNQPPPSPPPS